jgi:hypothetical protein
LSGHGHRETISKADALRWRDRVVADVQSDAGTAAALKHEVPPDVVIGAAELIAAYIAAGEHDISRADLALSISARTAFRVVRFLVGRIDMIRQIGAREGE